MNSRFLKALGAAIAVIAAVAIIATGSVGAKTSRSAVSGGSAVAVRHTALGETLVDANGRTLYLFEADRHNVSTLSAAGRAVWPPFTAARLPQAHGGAVAAKLGTTGGRVKQVTYNGHPLYYYIGDQAPGSTKGQHLKEFGALWYVLSPNGRAITGKASGSPTPASPTNNYGY
jgi:predicted lipoprotein with Yx(FWY)xxD motif